jgi:hypothetical protein
VPWNDKRARTKEGSLAYTHGVKRLGGKKYRIVYDVPPSGGRPLKTEARNA